MKYSPLCLAIAGLCLAPLPPAALAKDKVSVEQPASSKNLRNAGVKTAATLRSPAPIVVEQDYAPAPAIWLLEDEDTKIYMFGTIHVLPPGFAWRNDVFDGIVKEADELVVETSDADGDAKIVEFTAALLANSDTRTPTSQRLSPEAGRKWLKIAELSQIPADYFDSLPPIFAMFGAGIAAMEAQGSQHEYGVESVLEAEFAQMGKPVGSIEDSLDVLKALLAIDEELLIAQLEDDLAAWDGEDINTLMMEDDSVAPGAQAYDPFAGEHDWAQGRTAGLGDLGFGDSEFEIQIERVLLQDRNSQWTTWLQDRLERPGTILLAVGAAHLAGDVSVQKMLAERGHDVTRIQ